MHFVRRAFVGSSVTLFSATLVAGHPTAPVTIRMPITIRQRPMNSIAARRPCLVGDPDSDAEQQSAEVEQRTARGPQSGESQRHRVVLKCVGGVAQLRSEQPAAHGRRSRADDGVRGEERQTAVPGLGRQRGEVVRGIREERHSQHSRPT